MVLSACLHVSIRAICLSTVGGVGALLGNLYSQSLLQCVRVVRGLRQENDNDLKTD